MIYFRVFCSLGAKGAFEPMFLVMRDAQIEMLHFALASLDELYKNILIQKESVFQLNF